MSRTTSSAPFLTWVVALASAAGYLIVAYTVPRQAFGWLIGFMGLLFLGYSWFVFPFRFRRARKQPPDRLLFGMAIGFRLLLLLAMPGLSDDVYRFIWDGRLLAHGFNPYLYLPRALAGTEVAMQAELGKTLFGLLNSPDYFTVYPPLNQAMFALAAGLSGGSLLWNVIWLRVPIVLSELGTLWLMTKLLRRLNRNPNLALLYGLNPLVIIELTGNLHFEAVMIFCGLLAVWLLLQNHVLGSAGALALAITTKLLPLLLLPLVVGRLGWKKGLIYATLTGGFTLLLFVPFASVELIQNVLSSINLYFQKFEFNASVYYLLREMGYWLKGYNTIESVGRGLSIATTLGVLWMALRWQNRSAPVQVLATLTFYFALATTVHPWYVASVVAAAVFTQFRYPLLWSALILLSYYTYRTLPYTENLWLTAAEYALVVGWAVFELRANQKPKKPPTTTPVAFPQNSPNG